jgi:hypothetical protein
MNLIQINWQGKQKLKNTSKPKSNKLKKNQSEKVYFYYFRVDSLFEGSRDFLAFFRSYGFQGWSKYLQIAEKKAMPNYLPIYNKVFQLFKE